MKMYDKYFLNRLQKNLGVSQAEFRAKLHLTEQEQNRSFPDEFDYERLVFLVCEEYKISENEFFSDFRYGNIGKARQTVCFIMSVLGAKNIRISNVTGFKKSTISNSVRIISNDYDALLRIERILEKMNQQ